MSHGPHVGVDLHLHRGHLTSNSVPSSSASIPVQCAIQSVSCYACHMQADTCDNGIAANDLVSTSTITVQLTCQVVS